MAHQREVPYLVLVAEMIFVINSCKMYRGKKPVPVIMELTKNH